MTTAASPRRLLIAVAVVLIAAAAFWLLLLSPKQKQADKLTARAETQQQSLVEAQTKAAEGEAARKAFPKDYRDMVVLGKAVPEGDETASLIVQFATLAEHKHLDFQSLTLEGGGSGESSEVTSQAEEAGPSSVPIPVPPTEAEAALLPLGAKVGLANLGAMPYKLELIGTYSHLADFIHGVERLIKTHDEHLKIDGRLITLDGFTLTDSGGDLLNAEIGITAYLAPPSSTPGAVEGEAEGETAGAIPSEAAPAPEAETTTAAPSSYSTGEAR